MMVINYLNQLMTHDNGGRAGLIDDDDDELDHRPENCMRVSSELLALFSYPAAHLLIIIIRVL